MCTIWITTTCTICSISQFIELCNKYKCRIAIGTTCLPSTPVFPTSWVPTTTPWLLPRLSTVPTTPPTYQPRFSKPLQSQAPTYRRATCHKKGSHRWKKKQRKNTLKNRRNINGKVKKMFTSNLLPVHLSQNVPTTPCLGHPYPLPVPRIHVKVWKKSIFC